MNVDANCPLLIVREIHKHFPGVHALKGVSLDVRVGEVHALVGENGAGKSTLMHILAGVYQPDSGTIEFEGQSGVLLGGERAAQKLGIAIVFQERSLFSTLSVAENIFASRQPIQGWGAIDRRRLHLDALDLLKQVGLFIDSAMPVGELSPAQQQMVEIAKALSLNARLIIFDEPTAALSDTETRALFHVLATLKKRRVSVIYISHRLEEIFQVADRVTVLKDGEWQGTLEVSQTSPEQLISRMVGRELTLFHREAAGESREGPIVLEVRGLTDALEFARSRPFLRDVSFHVRSGEILALAGLAGAGRTELALSVFGARRRSAGEILIDGQPVEIRSPADAIASGIGYSSEDRKEAGLFLDMSVAQNVVANQLDSLGSWWVDDRKVAAVAEEYRQKLRIASRSVHQVVQNLSGGNQQKVVLSRWLLVNPRVLIVDEPTRGIDVGAKSEVHALLRDLARNGTAVMVISSDLPEVLAIADRVLVMREGTINAELKGSEATEENVIRYASMGSWFERG